MPRTLPAVVAAVALSALSVNLANAQFTLVDASYLSDVDQHNTVFTLDFNQAPDFLTLEPDGIHPIESFGMDFVPDPDGNPGVDADSIIFRGDEFHLGQTLPLRELEGNSSDTTGGGYGPILSSVLMSADNNSVSFTVPWKTLGLTEDKFRFLAFSTDNGSETASLLVTAVPLPPASWTALTVLGGLGATRIVRSLRRLR